jgi:arylsulfatase A-like enzyme
MRFRLIALAASLCWLPAAEPDLQPNIVVVVADDLGYADLGCTGLAQVATPNIDFVFNTGVRFTQGDVSAGICSPSCAGLITGRYQERWGHDDNACEDLALTESTLGDRLQALGYVTVMIGKWHLGSDPTRLPTRRGFDEVFHPAGNARYFGTRVLDSRHGSDFQPAVEKRAYTAELNAARAAEFITRHKDRPFGLYLAFNNVHTPFEVPQVYLDWITVPTANPERRIMLGMILALDDAVGVVRKAHP